MQQPTRDLEQSLVLSGLPGRNRRHLLARCERVTRDLADVLYEPGEPIRREVPSA